MEKLRNVLSTIAEYALKVGLDGRTILWVAFSFTLGAWIF